MRRHTLTSRQVEAWVPAGKADMGVMLAQAANPRQTILLQAAATRDQPIRHHLRLPGLSTRQAAARPHAFAFGNP
jgi:hypothetical protein